MAYSSLLRAYYGDFAQNLNPISSTATFSVGLSGNNEVLLLPLDSISNLHSSLFPSLISINSLHVSITRSGYEPSSASCLRSVTFQNINRGIILEIRYDQQNRAILIIVEKMVNFLSNRVFSVRLEQNQNKCGIYHLSIQRIKV